MNNYTSSDNTRIDLARIPQGSGSRLDSDTIDGLQAVTASKAAPNVLVATGSDGKLPSSVIPTSFLLFSILFGE